MVDQVRIALLPTVFVCCWISAAAVADEPDWVADFEQPSSPWVMLERQISSEPDLFRIILVKQDVQPQQPPTAPALEPSARIPSTADEFSTSLFASSDSTRSLLAPVRKERLRAGSDVISGGESRTRQTTDAGSLLRKSSTAFGVGTQRRNPVVVDPRVRGSRVGQLASSGSHWVPARIDLDTMLNKLDSRIVDDIIVVKGPYSVLYGPDLRFMDVELLHSPRYEDGWQLGGSSSLNYQTNGEQWYGRQMFQGGDSDWGFRLSYGHKTGNDYESGNGTDIPSSYNSRDVDFALGYDFSPDSSIEFHYLRLDQTGVEFPGQLFDMNYLVTDGFEATYELRNQDHVDRLVVDTWHNNTRFKGNAQSPTKKRQFPGLFTAVPDYTGFTDVDSTSSGYRVLASWDLNDQTRLTAGTDLRFIRQELDEFSSGTVGFLFFDNVNSPLPKSQSVNPGLFTELKHDVSDRLTMTAGTRVDFSQAKVTDNPADIAMIGLNSPPASLAEVLGTEQLDQNFVPWAAFLTGRLALDDDWAMTFGAGHSERPPSLTELYVAESFLFLLQNGENTATGDPRLAPEKLTQLDLGLQFDRGRVRGGTNGFYGWIHDYITFENMRVLPAVNPQQVSLKYVNTDLATLAGVESFLEFDATDSMTLFATLSYVEGQDRTRNGDFATQINGGAGNPSTRDSTKPRGFFSGVAGASSEPLPNILPLESRLGVRVKPQTARWSAELSARIVDNQDRVAASLLETPTPGYTVCDLRGTWQATRSCLLTAGVENFTNRNFREHLDFRSPSGGFRVLQPGVNFYFGSELKY